MPESVSYPDVHAQVMIALRNEARALLTDLWPAEEIEVREHYVIGDTVYEGVTIYDLGESYDDGVIGYEDVGYRCGVAVLCQRTTDATIDTRRQVKRTIEALRRRWKNQRLALNQFDYETVRRHVLRLDHQPVSLPRTIGDRERWGGQQLIVTSWTRELPDQTEPIGS